MAWTYAKKAFVLFLVSFILMYGGILSLSYADSISKENHVEEVSPSTKTMTILISPSQYGADGVFSLVMISDMNCNVTVSAPHTNITVKVNGIVVKNVSYSSSDVVFEVKKGDEINIWIQNPDDVPVPGSIYFIPPVSSPPQQSDMSDYKLFSTAGMFLFILSLVLFVAGLSYLWLLIRVEKNRGKFIMEPEKQPTKIETASDTPLAECPHCHKRIPADSKICPYCGAKFDTSVAICGSCGQTIPADAVVCPYCGAKLR